MKIKNISIIIFLIGVGGFIRAQNAWESFGSQDNRIIAQVDTIKITAQEFYYSYEYGPAFVKRKNDSKSSYLNYMINEKLLALDGYSRSLDTTGEARSIENEFVSDLATEELFKQDVLSEVELTDDEIDTAIVQKSLDVELQWLYSASEEEAAVNYEELSSGMSFDSLFAMQINDSVFADERSLKQDRFKLGQVNPELAEIIDTMETGAITKPLFMKDGWYILKLVKLNSTPILTETEHERLKQEAVNAVTKRKMDILSDKYVNAMMTENNPVIKRAMFKLLVSYMAYYYLPPDKYNEWNLAGSMERIIKENNLDESKLGESVLVRLKNGSYTFNDFVYWYSNRSQYIQLNKTNINAFALSLENMVWQMTRDKLLYERALDRKLDKLPAVQEQSGWWKDKIVSSMIKNEIKNSIEINANEVKPGDGNIEKLNDEYNARLLRKVLALKKKYSVNVNEDVLSSVQVSTENDPKAVDFYTVKRGGLIPRTPYPTIDYEWINWE